MSPRTPKPVDQRKAYKKSGVSEFSQNLRKKRIEMKMNQADLADLIGANRARVSEMEAGRFPSDPERLIAIADALGVTVDWLLTGREEPTAGMTEGQAALYERFCSAERKIMDRMEELGNDLVELVNAKNEIRNDPEYARAHLEGLAVEGLELPAKGPSSPRPRHSR